jgi:hypothetical protein
MWVKIISAFLVAFGMTTATLSKFVTQDEIDREYARFSQKTGGTKANYFGVLYLSKKFNIPISEAASFVSIAKDTGSGIDAYYHDREKRILYLYTFRWSSDHMSFKGPLEKLVKDGINKIFFDPTGSDQDHPLITSLKKHLFQNWREIDSVFIDFVFNGDPVDAEQSKVLGFLRESLEDKRGFIESYLSGVDSNKLHDLVFRYVSNSSALGNTSSSRQSAEYQVRFETSLSLESGNIRGTGYGGNSRTDTNQMRVIFVPLSNLYQMYSDLGERFFEKNLRSGLGEGRLTNVQIRDSLRHIIYGDEDPTNFTMYHNGVTLTAQILEDRSRGLVTMVEPRILNGAQTVKILKEFVDEELVKFKTMKRSKNAAKKKRQSNNDGLVSSEGSVQIALEVGTDKSDNKIMSVSVANEKPGQLELLQNKLAETKVLARIIRTSDEGFLRAVTINNNRQNPIMPWNLMANDLVQLSYEEFFANLGVYYERRENAYKNLLQEDDIDGSIDAEKGVIEVRKLAQTLLAIQGRIDRMSETKEIFENIKWYRDTFREEYLVTDPRKLIFLYKVQFRMPAVIRQIKELGAEEFRYASKAKNLIWCLCIQGLLNDSKFDRYVENYGSSTSIEAGVTEMLKKLAKTKILVILSSTFESKKYRDQIEKAKFSFLKSRITFADCMKVAQEDFKWNKKSL